MSSEEEQNSSVTRVQSLWRKGISEGLRLRGTTGKLFSKKFANTSRFVVSSKVWMNTIPTRDCDVLMVFPAKTSDQTLMWLLSRLRARCPELAVHVRHHSNTKVYGFYLTANYASLLKGAEDLGIRKPVKVEYGGGMKEFIFDDQEYFEGVDLTETFLNSEERQSIVKNMLYSLRAVEGDQLGNTHFIEGQCIVPLLLSKGMVKKILPLHHSEDLHYLREHWVKAFFKVQPLDKICDYFGVKIAMYFSYLGHYTKALMIPAFLGCFFWLLDGRNQTTDDIIFVVFAFINVIWCSLYLEDWKRKSAEKAYRWGTLDKEDELLVEPRPLFTGNLVKSAVTGRLEPVYPDWKRNIFRYFVSIPVIALCLSVVFVTMLWNFQLQDWVNQLIKDGHLPFFFKFFPKILLALCIGLLDDAYKKVAYWLNDQENYRLDDAYENHLIIKLVLFQFVNSFLSLFYIAFYLQDMDRLKDQLAALLITRQVVGNIKEALVPFVIDRIKLYRIGYKMTAGMSPDTLDRQMKEMTGIDVKKFQENYKDHEDHEGLTSLKEDERSVTETKTNNKGKESAIPDVKEQETGDESNTAGKKRVEGLDLITDKLDVSHSGPSLTQAEVEAAMKTYEDTFEDYLEMFIQFGYVTLFSSAFPMAAMCALLNNIIEIRSDAFKLCITFQRPFGQQVENIGTWQDALEFMSVIAVMVNCALIGMSGLADRLFPGWGATERIVFIVFLEHLILGLKMVIAYAIPDTPLWVAEEQARLEFMRREALKKLASKGTGGSSPNTPGNGRPNLEDTPPPSPGIDDSPEDRVHSSASAVKPTTLSSVDSQSSHDPSLSQINGSEEKITDSTPVSINSDRSPVLVKRHKCPLPEGSTDTESPNPSSVDPEDGSTSQSSVVTAKKVL